jgi:DNA-binding response OmpR family regulator
VLISDVGMPGEDGYSFIERLRNMGDWRAELPCVAVTALSRPEDRERALQAGYDEHVGKPFDPAGLCFTIAWLLRGKTKAKDDLEPAGGGIGSIVAGRAGRMSVKPHVLVAEDNLSVAELLKTCLEDRGYRVSLADSLKDGIALAEAEPVDLVVSDLRLKDGMGWDLLTRMGTRVPGIVMSGYMDDEHVKRSRAAGFSEYLVKPIDTDQLLNVVHDLLKRSRESEEGGAAKMREDERR